MYVYLLQVLFLQTAFLVFYKLFLKRETFFLWNRMYLLSTAFLSLLLPLVRVPAVEDYVARSISLSPVWLGGAAPQNSMSFLKTTEGIPWIAVIYAVGVAVSLILFALKLFRLFRWIYRNPVLRFPGYRVVLMSGRREAFSFLHYIFIDEELYRSPIRNEIIEHEKRHIGARHTWDLLFFEILKIFLWFDPLVYLYQKEIKQVHEFTVDAQLLRHTSPEAYFQLILQETFRVSQISFLNPFFSRNQLKQRIMMQTHKTPAKRARSKMILFAVFLAALFVSIQACKRDAVQSSKDDGAVKITKEDLQKLDKDNIETVTISRNPDKVVLVMKSGEKYVYYPDKSESTGKPFSFTFSPDELRNDKRFSLKDEVVLSYVDVSPVYPGCEGESVEELRKCFSEKVSRFVNEHFNKKLLENRDFHKNVVVIFTQFLIDENGQVTDIRARSRYKDLEREAKRVLAMLPRMEPGKQDGKPVKVRYTLPIKFRVDK